MKGIIIAICILFCYQAIAQFNGNIDPATAYNKYLVAQNNRKYTQIGQYKVLGTPYLFDSKHLGNMFAKTETGFNILLSYNVYNQEVEFTSSANPDEPLVKEPGTVDSFILKKDSLIGSDMLFIYGPNLGVKGKQYYLQLNKGDKYQLFKKYKANMEVVSTNYVESTLREFEITVEYYYQNLKTMEFKKLKPNPYFLKKEFSFVKNIENYTGEVRLNNEPEQVLKELFTELNTN